MEIINLPQVKNWNIEALTGYEPQTTIYTDLGIAERFGLDAVKDTIQRAFNEWKDDIENLTELVMAVNWKSWEHADEDETWGYVANSEMAILYKNEYLRLDEWCAENLKGEDAEYYYRVTD